MYDVTREELVAAVEAEEQEWLSTDDIHPYKSRVPHTKGNTVSFPKITKFNTYLLNHYGAEIVEEINGLLYDGELAAICGVDGFYSQQLTHDRCRIDPRMTFWRVNKYEFTADLVVYLKANAYNDDYSGLQAFTLYVSLDFCIDDQMDSAPLRGATPNMDELAASGTLFKNTYCTNPVCVCSRASMLSGQYTFHCHAWNNYKGIPANSETLFTSLARAGYRMGFFGKTDYVSGQHTQRARVSAWLRSAKIRKPQYDMGAPIVNEDENRRCHERDWKKIDDALSFLNANKDGEHPFFLYVSVDVPHPRCVTNKRYLSRINESAIAIQPKDVNEHPVMEYMRFCKNWHHALDEVSVRRARAIYYAMIAEVDEMLGDIMNAIKDVDNTYVFFLSDHGEMNMEHGQFYKYTAYEPSARVPLIIRGPGFMDGARQSHLASLIDIYPTILELTGATTTRMLDGCSLLRVLHGEKWETENQIFMEYCDSGACTGIHMLRWNQYKYIAYPGYRPQLFDLESDPWEVHDLSDARPDLIRDMDARMRKLTDYETHDRIVKEYDRDSFRVWRDAHLQAGDYYELMARVFCGADDWQISGERTEGKIIPPWTDANEQEVVQWLESDF